MRNLYCKRGNRQRKQLHIIKNYNGTLCILPVGTNLDFCKWCKINWSCSIQLPSSFHLTFLLCWHYIKDHLNFRLIFKKQQREDRPYLKGRRSEPEKRHPTATILNCKYSQKTLHRLEFQLKINFLMADKHPTEKQEKGGKWSHHLLYFKPSFLCSFSNLEKHSTLWRLH